MAKAQAKPANVTAVDGEVLIDGLPGVALSMTPEAAAAMSDRLLEQAAVATGQRIIAEQLAEDERARRRGLT